jgi:sugar phosphate isomerase/epimerase
MTAARVLFSTGSLYVFDIAYCFELSAAAGFDGMEVMCDERYSTRDPNYLKRMTKDYGLPVLVAHTPFSPRVPGWHADHDEIKRVQYTLRLAEELKAESIVVHLPRKRGRITLQVNQRKYTLPWRPVLHPVKNWIAQELPAVQARTKVKIAVENMPSKYVAGVELDPSWWNEPEEWSKVHQWLTLDTTHWATRRVDPLAAYRAAEGRVAHIHLSNYDGHEHRLPHKGSLNLKTFLRALAADGFAGTVSLELSPGALIFKENAVMRHNLQASLDFCREHLR